MGVLLTDLSVSCMIEKTLRRVDDEKVQFGSGWSDRDGWKNLH